MKDYFADEKRSSISWMTLYLDIIMLLLTLFVFFASFTEKDLKKVEVFKKHFKKSLMIKGSGKDGRFSITEGDNHTDPVKNIVNRMRTEGINRKIMDNFLEINDIKIFEVRDGKSGTALILPVKAAFINSETKLTDVLKKSLSKITLLARDLPYLLEIRGYSSESSAGKGLKISAQRSISVYEFFKKQGVNPFKMKVSGFGDAFVTEEGDLQDKVELLFKDPEL